MASLKDFRKSAVRQSGLGQNPESCLRGRDMRKVSDRVREQTGVDPSLHIL